MRGALKHASSSSITFVGIEELEERIKRRGLFLIMSKLLFALVKIVWCIVGTAVYQVGFTSSIQAKNFNALNPGEQDTYAPADKGANIPAISPCIWKSGMIFRPRSC